MIMILSTFINVVGQVYFINFFCEYLFPERTSIVKQYIIWKGMRYYTIIEMRVTKYVKLLESFITDIFPPRKREDILFIKDGDIVKKYYFDELFKDSDTFDNTQFPAYQFILYFIKLQDNEKFDYSVVRFNNHKELLGYKQLLDFKSNTNIIKPSRLKLLALQVKPETREGEPISINFGRYNYYMDKNILLDRPFIRYYLNTSHNITLQDDENYEVTFVDKDMNIITLTEEHKIEVKNNSYEIWINGVD